MRWRVVVGALLLFAAVVVGARASRTQVTERPVQQAGWVRMTTSEDGLTTVITVAAHQPGADSADVVDYAYRLQHLQPQHLAYEGSASVTHTLNQLLVLVGDAHGWRFPVAGRPVTAGTAPASYVEVPVLGLSQHWGTSIHRPHDEVVSMLAVGVCGEEEGAGSCNSCSTGGSGASGCGINCGDSSCSAECNAGSYACCNCPGRCRCCSGR